MRRDNRHLVADNTQSKEFVEILVRNFFHL